MRYTAPMMRGQIKSPADGAAVTLNPRGVAELAADLQKRTASDRSKRCIVVIAGIPGCGKSTLARALCIHLNRAEPGAATILALDGFHLPEEALKRGGHLGRKGSPGTFDAHAYFKALARSADPRDHFDVPVYDRRLHEPVFTGKPENRITPGTRYILTEGNYLLLDSLPWTAVDDLASVKWLLNVPVEQARAWLIRRHIATGRSIEEAQLKYDTNDKPNTQLVLDRGRHGDRVLTWPAQMLDGDICDTLQ